MSHTKSEKFESILSSLPMGSLVFDEAAQVVSANPAAERLLCKKLENMMHSRCWDLVDCVNRVAHPPGCGDLQKCLSCNLTTAVHEGLTEGKGFLNREAESLFDFNGKHVPGTTWIAVTTAESKWQIFIAQFFEIYVV